MRLIDANALREHMYHEAFETDSGLQKWDSGLWIRYQMFESILNTEITIDAEPVVRCKDCKWRGEYGCAVRIMDESDRPKNDDFCSWGERREE